MVLHVHMFIGLCEIHRSTTLKTFLRIIKSRSCMSSKYITFSCVLDAYVYIITYINTHCYKYWDILFNHDRLGLEMRSQIERVL